MPIQVHGRTPLQIQGELDQFAELRVQTQKSIEYHTKQRNIFAEKFVETGDDTSWSLYQTMRARVSALQGVEANYTGLMWDLGLELERCQFLDAESEQ